MPSILHTQRLTLRTWRDSDLDPFAAMNSDPRVMEFFPSTVSRQQTSNLMERINAHFDRHGFSLYAAEESNTFIGFIGLLSVNFDVPFAPAVEIGWRLAAHAWGRGLATEGARAVLDHAFHNLGLSEIVSFTVPANVRSRRVMEKIGMQYDTDGDFEHPLIAVGHPLRRHVLYRIRPY